MREPERRVQYQEEEEREKMWPCTALPEDSVFLNAFTSTQRNKTIRDLDSPSLHWPSGLALALFLLLLFAWLSASLPLWPLASLQAVFVLLLPLSHSLPSVGPNARQTSRTLPALPVASDSCKADIIADIQRPYIFSFFFLFACALALAHSAHQLQSIRLESLKRRERNYSSNCRNN